jgi:hypothetical protein
MRARPDIVVVSPDGRIQLVVEVKNHPGASEEWAADFRRNLVDHSILPQAEYFLLALPDHLFLRRTGCPLPRLWSLSGLQGAARPGWRWPSMPG